MINAVDKFCPRCGRADEQIGNCGSIVTPCPEPVALDPSIHATLVCGPCGKLVVIPVQAIVRGKVQNFVTECSLSACAAKLLYPQEDKPIAADTPMKVTPAKKPKPAPEA